MSITKLQFVALFLMVANYRLVHSQVTSFNKDTFNPSPTDLIYQGGAHVPRGSTFLRLTNTTAAGFPEIWSYSRALYSKPVIFSDGVRRASFEASLEFIVTPSQNGSADGITFFIAPVGATFSAAPTGSDLGIFNNGEKPHVFAVEFDTFANVPLDPKYLHIGVDIESSKSKATREFDSATGQVVHARINYDARTNIISVHATSGAQTTDLEYMYDLSTILPGQVQVGLSSSTGGPTAFVAIHDIIYWSFTSTLVYPTNDATYIRHDA